MKVKACERPDGQIDLRFRFKNREEAQRLLNHWDKFTLVPPDIPVADLAPGHSPDAAAFGCLSEVVNNISRAMSRRG